MSDLRGLIERWAPIVGYEGSYEVSDTGRVRSLCIRDSWGNETPRKEPLILRPGYGKYLIVRLCRHGTSKTRPIHRLVAEAFLGRPSASQHCAHVDGNHHHNHVSNLAWVSPKENEAHKLQHGRRAMGERQGSAKLTAEQVREIRSSYSRGNGRVLAERFGVSVFCVVAVARRRSWKHLA